MKRKRIYQRLFYTVVCLVIVQAAFFVSSSAPDSRHPARKVLFIGDSMTGWLSERLNAYGQENGFEVATVVWDGSTISKWGNSPRLDTMMREQDPDAVFISLGLNELFETRPEKKLKEPVEKIVATVGDRPMLWIGPPSWPGHTQGEVLDSWLAGELGEKSFFSSLGMELPRQSPGNPHPSKEGIIVWMDSVVKWMPGNSEVALPGIRKPEGVQMSRGKSFVYKRMKESI